MKIYKIAQVAQKLGISKQTLIRYEKKGILPKFARNHINSWREYTEEDVCKMKNLLHKGFTPVEKSTARKQSSPTGFTILEMLIVLLIAGILATLAIPRFAVFYSLKLDAGMKKVTSDIRYAQQMAIARHGNCRIVFNPAGDTYTAQEQVVVNGSWDGIKDPFTQANLAVNFQTDPQYKGIDILNANFNSSNTLQFDWQGIPQSGGNVTFNCRGNVRTVSVEQNTGRVKVQ